MAEVKVIMLGGKRTGKSSILAGMIEAINYSALSSHLIVKDNTDYSNYNGQTIENKRNILTKLQERMPSDAEFMTLTMADSKVQRYTITFCIPKKPGILTVDFYDVPGEHANPARLEFKTELLPLIRQCDVFIVAIDTPFLMEASSSVNDAVNRVTDLQSALQNIIIKNECDIKMVIFAPVKCEKWANDGKINDVVQKVKSTYHTLIDSLSFDKMIVRTIPIQTVGNIVFDSFHKAQLICKEGEMSTYPCFPLEGNDVRVSNGRIFSIRQPYSVKDDVQAVIEGIKIPNAWYRLAKDKSFCPVNCEQPALHILEFLIDKTELVHAQSERDENVLKKCISFLKYVANWWKGVDYEAFHEVLKTLRSEKVIKHDIDGVETLYHYANKKDCLC